MGFVLQPRPVEQMIAIVVLIVNVFVPGVGTAVYSAVSKDAQWVRAILQFLGAIILIGWISAVIDGIKVLMASSPAQPAT